ncbi:hypothetical protein RMSM_00117 [Rhodopirellula maiorica SM1]|uniref:Uncharacterized protein n=1 Tax=Rhodopirellula maiorica SM1 TaxID=1265738 RepID=M5RUD8_9BACT|nr:hypothetical protein RMSM_00117 [Rhodopirellula maiorica SM1]
MRTSALEDRFSPPVTESFRSGDRAARSERESLVDSGKQNDDAQETPSLGISIPVHGNSLNSRETVSSDDSVRRFPCILAMRKKVLATH